jgi:hypothetical protein
MRERAARCRDLSAPLKVFGAWIDKTTNDDFQESHEYGDVFAKFPPLADSTIERRIGRHGGYARKTRKDGKAGAFTKKALGIQKSFSATNGIKPLIDTAAMMNSARTTLADKTSLQWSALGRLIFHMTGSLSVPGRPPRRNPTVFEVDSSGVATLKPKAQEKLNVLIGEYIASGKVVAP